MRIIHIARQEQSTKKTNKQGEMITDAKCTRTKIYKIAQNMTKVIPKPEAIAIYVESIKMYLKDNPDIEAKLKDLIINLPSPTKIKKDLSIEECNILFETVGYLWRKITGQDIIDESKMVKAPETLLGNYWMLKNGVLLHGINHFSIVKQNSSIFATLLNLNGFALQQYLVSPPLKLIRYIVENGGMRIFVNKNKDAYFQMSEDTYADWGRAKVKGLDFKSKIVKIVDFKIPYKGWKNGIAVKL